MKEKIFLSSPHMSEEGYEQAFIQEAFDKNWIAPQGANVDGFEKELAEYVNIGHAAALSSGTAALHLAVKLAEVEKEDIVFVQSLTFSATANIVLYENARPVFIDSDEKTWNMDPDALEEAFKKYPEVKAVIVVHLYGMSADMDRITKLCDEYDVKLIEDAAESLGARYKNQASGTHGDYGIYSFNGNKIITSSGGGMLVSNDKAAIDKARFWATQAREDVPYYEHKEIGYNYRLSNISAGIGRGQLKVLDRRVEKKRYIYEFYKRELAEIEDIHFMPENDWDYSNRWLSCILLSDSHTPSELINKLAEENIEARHLWKPMHLQPIFKKYDYIGNKVSEKLFNTGVCLPSDTKMTDKDLYRVCKIIKGMWE
ncbi:MAG: aminotransferase class I/II-fold pyridoxal phosphate-dependent enzyme [Tetragenococcus halophilus]|nr:aminotransferase class I/II-fold pyridoxal phosphate-dependent enzyme [Tetragenococcus halophilus]